MKKNDIIELDIVDVGVGAEGIGKFDGYTFFVKNAVMGDKVEAIITKMNKGYGFAKVTKLLSPSPDRCEPPCKICDKCGGCQIMQINYDAQLRLKENKVKNNLERIGGVNFGEGGAEFLPIIGMEPNEFSQTPTHYRNKVQFPIVKNKEGKTISGFYAGRTHYIIETDTCPASLDFNDKILATIRAFLDENNISTYSEESGNGLVRHVLIRNGFKTGQTMVCLVINGESLSSDICQQINSCANALRESTTETLEEKFATSLFSLEDDFMKITSICLNINKENTNVILGNKNVPIHGPLYIEDKIVSADASMKELLFRISPLSFYQVNPTQTSKLYDAALKAADLKGDETVWDLYCGIGTISLFLAQKAKKVIGVEIVPEAIEDAKENALLNGISNAEFFCGKSEEVFPDLVGSLDTDGNIRSADIVVLDPPRKGCDKILLDKILEVGPERIVYVSCDSATLARDIKILTGAGACSEEKATPSDAAYKLISAQPVDMFPNTVHVETAVKLCRGNVDAYIEARLDTEMLEKGLETLK